MAFENRDTVGCILKGRDFEVPGRAQLHDVVDTRDLRGLREGTFWAKEVPVTILSPGTEAELILEDGSLEQVVLTGSHSEELTDEGKWSILVVHFLSRANVRPSESSDAD